jgi:hypothetical protein
MSIATLKKKTAVVYNNMSVNKKAFSLNGTHRSQGYVGQDTLGRTLPKTIMKGNVAKGHGGCCGQFVKHTIIQSAVVSLNNPNIVKSSVLNTNGMIANKFKWIKRPYPFATVKPDNNLNINAQSDYIRKLQQYTVINSDNSNCQRNKYVPTNCKKIGAGIFSQNTNSQKLLLTKQCIIQDNNDVINSEGKYVLLLGKMCVVNDIFKFTHKTNGTPLPGN